MAYPEYMDYLFAAARGLENHSYVHKFGHTSNASTTSNPVWSEGGQYTYITTAKYLKIGSDAAVDAAAGTGARVVNIQGLDSDYNLQSENVTLNGFTGVTTANEYLRIFRMKTMSVGSLGYNNGKVVAYPDQAGSTLTATGVITTTGIVLAAIETTTNQTLMAIYTVPGSYTAYLITTWASCSQNNEIQIDRWERDNSTGEPFQLKERQHFYRGQFDRDHILPIKINGKTDIELRAAGSTSAAAVWSGFDLLLIKE